MFNDIVDGLNKIAINVWAILVITGGIVLTLHSHADVGTTLITGGFALLRGEPLRLPAPKQEPEKTATVINNAT